MRFEGHTRWLSVKLSSDLLYFSESLGLLELLKTIMETLSSFSNVNIPAAVTYVSWFSGKQEDFEHNSPIYNSKCTCI